MKSAPHGPTLRPVWNLTPLFPGDGSCVFMDYAGGMYRVNLATGAEIWKTLPTTSRWSFSDGGAGLGPNQMVYSCSNPRAQAGSEGTTGIVRAFHLSNGTEAWYVETAMPCNSYPSVGHLAGVEPLAVVVVPGSFMGQENLHGEILALDAATGAALWSHPVTPYSGPEGQAAGDFEGFAIRAAAKLQPVCLPAHWSSPMIDGNGMVIVGRADGKMYKVYGPQSSFKGTLSANMSASNGTLAEVVPMGSAFLHGALAAAPGMFAISSCDTLYVFKKWTQKWWNHDLPMVLPACLHALALQPASTCKPIQKLLGCEAHEFAAQFENCGFWSCSTSVRLGYHQYQPISITKSIPITYKSSIEGQLQITIDYSCHFPHSAWRQYFAGGPPSQPQIPAAAFRQRWGALTKQLSSAELLCRYVGQPPRGPGSLRHWKSVADLHWTYGLLQKRAPDQGLA